MATAQPSDNWQLGNPYERYVGRWSRLVARSFLDWLDVPAGRRWLDLGCGTGALCAAVARYGAAASITGIEPSAGFLKVARATLPSHVTLVQGDAGSIPLRDGAADVVVSGLVLNFIPDLPAALREVARVSTTGASFGAYVWDYAGKMEIMRHFWDAAVELDPNAAALDEGVRFPLCHPDALLTQVANAGFHGPEVTPIDVATDFTNFEDYWDPFLGGQGPAPSYVMSLDAAARSRLKDRVRARLPRRPDGSISLLARAWAVRART